MFGGVLGTLGVAAVVGHGAGVEDAPVGELQVGDGVALAAGVDGVVDDGESAVIDGGLRVVHGDAAGGDVPLFAYGNFAVVVEAEEAGKGGGTVDAEVVGVDVDAVDDGSAGRLELKGVGGGGGGQGSEGEAEGEGKQQVFQGGSLVAG